LFKKSTKWLLIFIFSWQSGCHAYHSKQDKSFAHRKEVKQFIDEMHKKHGLDKNQLTSHFSGFKTEKKILQLMSRQYEALPWYQYRKGVVTKVRIKEGVLFWKENEALLKRAENQFGVPAEMIVAIIGIESAYGKKMGNYPVLQALSTLAFDYPRRAKFFRGELEEFLLLSNEERLDPTIILGSYAGAMGMGQFMPSSYRRYAIDFHGVGKKDLIQNHADVIASVANYFKMNGWRTGENIAYQAIVLGKNHQKIMEPKDLKPNVSLKELANRYNVKPKKSEENNKISEKARFVALQNFGNSKEYWLLLHNFYVITRYNRSTHYAMAVYQLSQEIRIHKRG